MAKKNCCKIPIAYWIAEATDIALINPSFEDGPVLPNPNSFVQTSQDNVAGWQTDASDGEIELWSDGFLQIEAFEGSVFAELSSSEKSRLFQTLTVPPDASRLVWSTAHRARARGRDAGAPGTSNTANFIIGLDGVESIEQVMVSDSGEWSEYSGVIEKPCGVTEILFALEAVEPDSATGNFVDALTLTFYGFFECRQGTIDCCGKLLDSDGVEVDLELVSFCDPRCEVEPEPPIETEIKLVDCTWSAVADLSGEGNAAAVVTISNPVADDEITIAGDTITTNVAGDVTIFATAEYQNDATNGAAQRVAPRLVLQKVGGSELDRSSTGYIRHITGHRDSSNSVHGLDKDAAAGDSYQILTEQGSAQNDSEPIDFGRVRVEVRQKIEVVSIVTDSEPTDPVEPGGVEILPDCGQARANFFNENQFSWGFGITASNQGVSEWQYVITGADYDLDASQITNNNQFVLTSQPNSTNPALTDYVFTGVNPIPANGSVGSFEIPGVNFGFDPSSQSQAVGCVV